jgi:hypothetical protein
LKKGRLTARILLYAILFAAIVATWIVVTELEAPAPEIAGDEIDAFQAQLADSARGLVAERSEALSQIGNLDEWHALAMTAHRGVPTSIGFQAEKSRVETVLTDRIGLTSRSAMATGQYDLPELGDVLDEADSLYEEQLSERTSAMESVYRESMIDSGDDYIGQLSYYALAAALRRDLIKYRQLNSLPLHEIKLNYYQGEYVRFRDELASMRSTADALANERADEIEAKYDDMVAALIAQIAATLAEQPSAPEGPVMGADILESLELRISELPPVYLPAGLRLTAGPMPSIDRSEWLAYERDTSSRFLDESGSETE